MLTRTPSIVPFLALFSAAAILWPFLPAATAVSTPFCAALLIGIAIVVPVPVLAFAPHLGFLPTITAALWLIPLLYGLFQREPLCLLALVPLWRKLGCYLPEPLALPGHGFIASSLLQLALMSALIDQLFLSGVLASVGLVLILWIGEPSGTRSWARIPSAALALAVTFALLSPPPPPKRGSSSVRSVAIAKSPSLVEGGSSDYAHMAILVRPDIRAEEKKLPPPPRPQMRSLTSTEALPLEIPFSGVYWLFQEPLMRVPAGAPEFSGAPADYRFHSDDTTPLHLEALQTFRFRYPLRQFASISVRIRNSDLAADTLAMGLMLEDSQGAGARLNLDPVPIGSHLGEQTLSFPLKPSRYVVEFDTLLVRFYLGYSRRHIAPRIAVEAFRFHR